MVYPKSKSEAVSSSSCFGYKNKTTWKSISFWQVDIVHKLILFKWTPNNILFKSKTKYTVMFGILITSVFTWHFVYLTVLFFRLFSSMVAITGRMIHSLLQEANDRVVRLWDGGEKKSCSLSDKQRPTWTTSTLQSVWSGRSLARTPTGRLSFFFSGGAGGQGFGGFVPFYFFSISDIASDDPGGPAPPTFPARWRLTGWGHQRPAVATKRHKLKRVG